METTGGIAIVTRSVVHVPDIEEPSAGASMRKAGRVVGFRSDVTLTMLREGEAVGAINVTRPNPGRFSAGEVALLKTFADQAVIAVENVRLFTELQTRNREITEALEQQTATSEILRVISRSPTDPQPVLDAIVERAPRLSSAQDGAVAILDGDLIHLVASYIRQTGSGACKGRS